MARRTNYSFERNARAKAKAAKREAKLQAKRAKSEKARAAQSGKATDEAPADSPAGQSGTDPGPDGLTPPDGG